MLDPSETLFYEGSFLLALHKLRAVPLFGAQTIPLPQLPLFVFRDMGHDVAGPQRFHKLPFRILLVRSQGAPLLASALIQQNQRRIPPSSVLWLVRYAIRHRVKRRAQSQLHAVVPSSVLLLFSGGPNEPHECGSPAVKERTRTRTEATPTDRRGTRGAGKQLERRITDNVRSRSAQDQPGAEGAMGEDEDSEAEAHDLSGGSQADRGGAASTVGEGEARGVKETDRAGELTRPRRTSSESITPDQL